MTDLANTETKTVNTMTPLKKAIGFGAMVLGMFMAILDIQIVSASLAEIQAGLGASPSEGSWVQTAYLIAEVIMIPLSGFLSRVLSTRVLFTSAAIGFTVSSVLCATATTITEMIIYRAMQGFIGGAMIPSVFAAAFTVFTPEKRTIVSPIIGLVATVAPTIGPTIGGILSHSFSWHWLFLVNLPPGIIVSILAWKFIDFDKPDHSLFKKFDWWGLFGLAAFLGSLEYVLEEGPRHDWLQDNTIFFFTIFLAFGAVIFFWRAFKAQEPIVDLRTFSNLNFSLGTIFSFVLGMGLYGLTYLYPLYLGQIRHYDSLMIGNTMFVSGLAMFAAAPIAGFISNKIDPRITMSLGFAGFAMGTWLVTGLTSDWDFWELFIPQLLRGGSLMLAMVQINNVALGTLPPERIKAASGIFNLTRNLGGAVGLAIINTIVIKRTDFHTQRLAEMINQSRYEAVSTLEAFQRSYSATPNLDSHTLALSQLNNIVKMQGNVLAFADAFFVLTLLFIMLVILVWLVKKPKNTVEGGH